MARTARSKATDVNDTNESETQSVTEIDTVPAPATSDFPSESNPENDAVPAEKSDGPVIPEGASRAHVAALKRHYIAEKRLTKLDARAAKAEQEYRETQQLLAEKRPGYAADVAAAQVDVDYHATRVAQIEKARNASLGAAQARAAGDHETAAKLDEQAENDTDPIDSDDEPTAVPTNAGHVDFE